MPQDIQCKFLNPMPCTRPAEWTVRAGAKGHEMHVCSVHVREYQKDRNETGDTRTGRLHFARNVAFVIAKINTEGKGKSMRAQGRYVGATLPDDLMKRLVRSAKAAHRSVAAELRCALEAWLKRGDQPA